MIEHKYNWLLERENEHGECSLRLRVKWNKNKEIANFTFGIRVEKSKWIAETSRCKNNTTHTREKISAYEINRRITEIEQSADDIFYEHSELTATEFKEYFNNAIGRGKENKTSIFIYLDQFVETMGKQNSWSESSYKKFTTLKNQLLDFKQYLAVEDLSKDLMYDFLNFLVDRGYRNTHIDKVFKFFNWFIRWLATNEIYQGNVHNTFKPRLRGIGPESHSVIYLTWEELQHLYKLEIPNQSLDQVRDVFCFCCFTSLRYSDVKKLKHSDVKANHIEVVTQKTVDTLKIDLNDFSRAILEKYKNFDDDLALPVISNQKMNDYLKDLCKLAELNEKMRVVYFIGNKRIEEVHEKWELITTHCGRRTFVVNALYLGIPAEVVMKWTGHSDYKAMKPYIAIVDDLKSKEMSKFNNLFKSAD